ncbi:hypothetical protein Purlil1_4898 [Purpureocillium lilacinum]|uniref:Transmembrane protein n=1 Tax=Purpureocillium lilacinum TaxID=33203 RepID=A0ABR0C3H4_PURLI|nr:hypothetical protein Purlil1_4898 [Purpureocillium lilacinum]
MPNKKGKKNATSADATSRHVSQGGKIITSPTAAEEHQQQQQPSASASSTPLLPRPTLPRQGTHSLTPSPLRSGVSYRSIGPASSSSSASGGLVPGSPSEIGGTGGDGGGHVTGAGAGNETASSPPLADFWRLLPMTGGMRRDSRNAAGTGTAGPDDTPGGAEAPSWLASSSSSAAGGGTPGSASTVKNLPPKRRAPPSRLNLVTSNFDRLDAETREQGRGGGNGHGQHAQRPVAVAGIENDAGDGGGLVLSPEGQFVKRRWEMNSTMHAAVFMAQGIVVMGVACVLLAAAMWKHDNVDAALWDVLATYVQPALALIFILCVGTLAAHETLVLSTVVLLYLQAAILLIAIATSMFTWVWLFSNANHHNENDNDGHYGDADWQLLKGVVVSCIAALMGTTVFAFVRIAAVWWVVEEQGELGGDVDEFHEFVLVNFETREG